MKIIWTNSWFAPDKEKKAAESLNAAGADVIGQNVDSPAAGQYARVGRASRGSATTRTRRSSRRSRGSRRAVYNWGPYYLKRIKAAMNGTWKTGFYYGSLKDGFTQLAPFGTSVSAKTKALIAQAEGADRQRQVVRVHRPDLRPERQAARQAGAAADRATQLYAMNWLVKGVIGSPKG